MKSQYSLILTTINDEASAESLAKSLCQNKLAACIQIQRIKSVYTWKEELCNEQEFLLMIKTRADLYEKVEAHILTNHPYEIPEIIQFPIERGLVGYLGWIDQATGRH